jgi:hypothetical protein
MKRTFGFIAALMLFCVSASAQRKADPEGYLTYSLPSTVISIDVEAVQEKFYAGPYAKYAEKYLGIKPRVKDETTIQLTQVRMTPLVEPDQSRRYSIDVKKKVESSTMMKLASGGFVTFADAKYGDQAVWRFPTAEEKGDFAGKGVSSNLTSGSTTLYKKDDKESTYNRIAVQQDMVVEKTLEQKAAETAEMILKLRKQRLQIVTGDTDATYSGEAMGAAIEELTRLENEYMILFTGYSERQPQHMTFEVIPDPAKESQMYVAFRMSETGGLVPADNLSGKPVLMEIAVQDFVQPTGAEEKKSKDVAVYYRIPAACTVKLLDGMNLILQSRMPIYQLGQESSLPVNMVLK